MHEETSMYHNNELPSPIGADEQSTNNEIDLNNTPIMIVGTENELFYIEILDPNFFLTD